MDKNSVRIYNYGIPIQGHVNRSNHVSKRKAAKQRKAYNMLAFVPLCDFANGAGVNEWVTE